MIGQFRRAPDGSFNPEKWQARIQHALENRLPDEQSDVSRLQSAMRYAVLGNGKRIRPLLVYISGEALGVAAERLDGPAIAVELIHSYSLIHDDLPAMDNDDLRRGRPTCHIAYDEATAILAGDALQMLAVQVLADDQSMHARGAQRIAMISMLAKASGVDGMAAGQAMDLEAAGKSVDKHFLERMHLKKTGELIRASVMLGALSADQLSDPDRACLDSYGAALGLAFQIQDDILDSEGNLERMGKRPGQDEALAKPNYPATVGMAEARRRTRALHEQAIAALDAFSGKSDGLLALSSWLLQRDH